MKFLIFVIKYASLCISFVLSLSNLFYCKKVCVKMTRKNSISSSLYTLS